jgi:membrane fusion protein, adhesin transport system
VNKEPGHDQAITSVSADLVEAPTAFAKAIICFVGLSLALAIAWSHYTTVLEVAVGPGTVVPEHSVQVVQSLEGGVVEKIFAKSGDRVSKGSVIVRLDSTPQGASRDELSEQLAGLEAAAARHRAYLDGSDPRFPGGLASSHPGLVAQSLEHYQAGKAELAGALTAIDSQVEQRQLELSEIAARRATNANALKSSTEELASLRKLMRAGAAGQAEVRASENRNNELRGLEEQLRLSMPRIDASIAELGNRRAERVNAFRNEAAAALAEEEIKIATIRASLVAQQKRLDQTTLKASAEGILKIVNATSVGQVVKPGEVIAEIVPEDDSYLVRVRVRPEDIAFLRAGMAAVIKLSAYDFSIFGSLPGSLERIAADSTTDERGQVYYLVDVRAERNFIERLGERWPIKSGMVANVEIVTGRRSVLQYITKPIHRMATTALRER